MCQLFPNPSMFRVYSAIYSLFRMSISFIVFRNPQILFKSPNIKYHNIIIDCSCKSQNIFTKIISASKIVQLFYISTHIYAINLVIGAQDIHNRNNHRLYVNVNQFDTVLAPLPSARQDKTCSTGIKAPQILQLSRTIGEPHCQMETSIVENFISSSLSKLYSAVKLQEGLQVFLMIVDFFLVFRILSGTIFIFTYESGGAVEIELINGKLRACPTQILRVLEPL